MTHDRDLVRSALAGRATGCAEGGLRRSGRSIPCGLAFLLCVSALASCGAESPTVATSTRPVPNVPPRPGLSRLSGVWTGTLTVTQIGQCRVADTPQPTRMEWTVTDTGELMIRQEMSKIVWSDGRVAEDGSITVTKTGSCVSAGISRPYTATHAGSFREHLSGKTASFNATEVWCFPQCEFAAAYELTKE